MNQLKRILSILFISLIGVISFSGCQKSVKPYKEQNVVTVGENQIYLDEMMYHIMIAEFQGQLINSYFGNKKDYWEGEHEKGITVSEAMKAQVMEDVIRYEVLYQEAINENMTLTEEEKNIAHSTVMNMQKDIMEQQLTATQLSREDMEAIQEKMALANKYYIESLKRLKVDEETIKKQINLKDYVTYDLQYLFVPTTKGNLDAMTQEEKKQRYTVINSYLEEAKKIEEFEKIDYEKDKDIGVKSGEVSFIMNEQPFGEEVEILEQVLKLEVGQVSDVFETCKGYYIIKCSQKDDTTQYDEVVKAQQQETFDAFYEELKTKYQIKINQPVWKTVKLGYMTINTSEN